MLEAVAGEASGRLPDFNPQELSNLLVSYARAHNPPQHYLNLPLLKVGFPTTPGPPSISIGRHHFHLCDAMIRTH